MSVNPNLPESVSTQWAAESAAVPLTRAWLTLAVGALGLSALFAVLLVVSRAPFLSGLADGGEVFRTALVLHVDFSIVVWFMAFAGALWSLLWAARWPVLGWFSFALASGGGVAMLLAAALGTPTPVLSNYVPVLDDGLFLWGLGALLAGVMLLAARTLADFRASDAGHPARAVLMAAAVVYLLGGAVLLGALGTVDPALPRLAYFDTLFWGAGHVLQFGHALLMVGAWLWACGPVERSTGWFKSLTALAVLPVLVAVGLSIALPPEGTAYRGGMTAVMVYGGWFALLPLVVVVLRRSWHLPSSPERDAVRLSGVLFLAGACVGGFIRGDDLLVPAHYHGVIGAVTLAYMGLTYRLLPYLGLPAPSPRLARTQVLLYGCGLLVLMAGLAWSGAHGVARKTPGAEQVLEDGGATFGMWLMGAGGLVALAGVLAFVLLVLGSLPVARRAVLQPAESD